MSYEINGIKYDYDSTTNQRIKGNFVDQHVYTNVDSMVEYILRMPTECYYDDPPFTLEDVDNYFIYECLKCGSFNPFEEVDDGYKCRSCGHITQILDNTHPESQEAYPWYTVSNFLCKKLKEKGEPVIVDKNIWGRTGEGQEILLDDVISEICYEMEILEGQRYSWEGRQVK